MHMRAAPSWPHGMQEYINLWPAAVLTAALMLLTGCMNADQARRSIYWVSQRPHLTCPYLS